MKRIVAVILLLAGYAGAQCTSAPVISNWTVTFPTPSSITASWDTDVPSDTLLVYGNDGNGTPDYYSYPVTARYWTNEGGVTDLTGVTHHVVTYTGLQTSRTITVNARSRCVTGGAPVTDVTKFGWVCDNASLVAGNCANTHIFTTPAIVTTDPEDFAMGIGGGQDVYNGYGHAVIQANMWQIAGNDSNVSVAVTGLNACMTGTWKGLFSPSGSASWGSAWEGATYFVGASGCAPVTYTLTFTITSSPSGKVHSLTFPLTVKNLPSFTFGTPSSYPTPPCTHAGSTMLDSSPCTYLYDTIIQQYGALWAGTYNGPTNNSGGCARTGYAGNDAWAEYYDGGRGQYQVFDYVTRFGLTANPASTYDTGGQNCVSNYLTNYAAPNSYNLLGNRTFTEGAYMDWLRHGTTASWNALVGFDGHSNLLPPLSYEYVYDSSAREAAYGLGLMRTYQKATRVAQATGNPVGITEKNYTAAMADQVDQLLGILDQNINATGPLEQDSYDGLVSEELMRYYDDPDDGVPDPRIPVVIKALADHLFDPSAHRWAPTSLNPHGWCLECKKTDLGLIEGDVSEINMMAVRMYGWLFAKTGNLTYQVNGDTAFEWGVQGSGASGGWPQMGKNFSEDVRSSPFYVYLRTNPSSSIPASIRFGRGVRVRGGGSVIIR